VRVPRWTTLAPVLTPAFLLVAGAVLAAVHHAGGVHLVLLVSFVFLAFNP
jgi:hypothetical protein